MSIPVDHAAARVALDDGEGLARVIAFAPLDLSAALREAQEQAERRTPEERASDDRRRARLRLNAAKYLLKRGDARGRALAINALKNIRAGQG